MSRHWTRVVLVRDPRGWHPSRLFLGCHGRRVEIRTRLVESERENLAYALERALGCGRPDERQIPPLSASGEIGIGGLAAGYCEGEVQAMTRIRFPVEGEKSKSGAEGAQV
jgi:hypothetical protein